MIYDLMIRYENVYTDVSFILFNEYFFSMLKFILNDPKVAGKTLYGTDYDVVTQKKTEKSLFHDLRGYLDVELFFNIAHENPKRYLKTALDEVEVYCIQNNYHGNNFPIKLGHFGSKLY